MSNPRIPRPFFCGNWKLWGSLSESVALATGVRDAVAAVTGADVAVGPGFVALATVAEKLKGSATGVAAQDGYWEFKGAFTGAVAMAQIADAGAKYAIVGHSERRQYFGETDETVNRRLQAALRHNLVPIFCVGETLSEREGGRTWSVIEQQLRGGLTGLSVASLRDFVIAYEPVWAIGTGKTATPEEAQEVHHQIRTFLANSYGAEAADGIRLLYGGSVKPSNSRELLGKADIDGALVGGASLDPKQFAAIVRSAH
jgi:triosephosphate isomerase